MIKLDIPDAFDVNIVADWAELNIVYEQEALSKSALASKIEGAVGSEPSDVFISSVWDELSQRSCLYGEPAPFAIEPWEIIPCIKKGARPEYEMCLMLSLLGNSINPTPTGKLFERVVKEALQAYIGGNAIVFGHPTPLSVQDICIRMNEKFKMELPPHYKDRGLDIIGWKPFNDNRGNQLVVMMQCAGGKNWITKTGDIVLRAWTEKYMMFGCTPTKGFATVVVISDRDKFEEVSFETDLLFDRPRIYRYANSLNEPLKSELRSWCVERSQEF